MSGPLIVGAALNKKRITFIDGGIKHPRLPEDVLLEDGKAAKAFESYLNKAVSETVYTDYFFWQSSPETHSAEDAKQMIAGFFAHRGNVMLKCHRDGQKTVCDSVHVLSAALVYEIGVRLGRFNVDGEGISFSEVAKHYRQGSFI